MKQCCTCKETKKLTEFNKKHTTKDGLQNICRECSKKRSRKYYKDNREQHYKDVKANNRRYVKRNIDFVQEYKSIHGCLLCPEKANCCLDFHHVRDKEVCVSVAVYLAYSIDKLKKEMDKCILLCANCHRKLHAGLISLGNPA